MKKATEKPESPGQSVYMCRVTSRSQVHTLGGMEKLIAMNTPNLQEASQIQIPHEITSVLLSGTCDMYTHLIFHIFKC